MPISKKSTADSGIVRALLDTNVILDAILRREPFALAAQRIWAACELGAAEGFVAAHALTTIHYVIQRHGDRELAAQAVASILGVLRVAAVDDRVLRMAAGLSAPDFEDAVTAIAAMEAKCDYLVTRDPKGFRNSPVPVLSPDTAATLLDPRGR